jgi:hypothetical protein
MSYIEIALRGGGIRMKEAIKIVTVLMTINLMCPGAWGQTETTLSKRQSVYVPVYSQIYHGIKERPFDLTVTISIRNTDPNNAITVLSVDNYDSNAKLLRKYVEKPIQLNAMASTRYVVKHSDKTGGSGASFIVKWEADHPVNPPIIESVMIGTQGQQGLSFTSRGQAIK